MKNSVFEDAEHWRLCQEVGNGVDIPYEIPNKSDRLLLHQISQEHGLIALCPEDVIAIKYSPNDSPVYLDLKLESGSVLFVVKDEGIGIEKEHLSEIFSRFYQVNQYLSRAHGGCGLGLSIVKYVMKAHNTTIDVESEMKKGSLFKFRIPAYGEV